MVNSKTISIVDYGSGNIQAIKNILLSLNVNVRSVTNCSELVSSEKLILPGVGAFDFVMKELNASGMIPMLNQLVLEKRVPVLGICVGMQIMGECSEEGKVKGLNWINALAKKFVFKNEKSRLPLPHMGWNEVNVLKESPLFTGMKKPSFYFLHSYHLETLNSNIDLGSTVYGQDFISAIQHENIYATQFHPEKSHVDGVHIMKNFVEYC